MQHLGTLNRPYEYEMFHIVTYKYLVITSNASHYNLLPQRRNSLCLHNLTSTVRVLFKVLVTVIVIWFVIEPVCVCVCVREDCVQ